MTLILILATAIVVFGIVAAFRDVSRDGYRRVPTRSFGEEILTRYR